VLVVKNYREIFFRKSFKRKVGAQGLRPFYIVAAKIKSAIYLQFYYLSRGIGKAHGHGYARGRVRV
jgi:hypothetical protein